ncbi:helix-turn-helix transcriptional regulator [Marivita sp. S0852]|uniref:helix-turn-helix transcriptional regulator n=1 Tax=Marivita sp. S0852 TaxID=3373893 RepID=UPI0039819D88
MRFSTRWLPEKDRLDIWREEFGRRLVHLDFEPLDDMPLLYDTTFLNLGNAVIAKGEISAISCSRTRLMLNDGNSDIVLLIRDDEEMYAEQGKLAQSIAVGEGLVRRSDEAGRTLLRPGKFLTLNLPVEHLTERVADIDRLGMAVIPGGTEALGLLAGYCRMMMALQDGGSAAARSVMNKHVLDLASLAIGANRDAWLVAQDRGVRAARRLAAICAIRKNAHRPDFRIAELAREFKVSESYLRKLFAEVSQTFSSLLLEARLVMAREKLLDQRFDTLHISQIAFDCGFSDVSYFNRTFYRRFEMTPTDARKR